MQTISINFIIPSGWTELSDKQLRYIYEMIAQDFATDEIKTLALLKWSSTKIVGRQESGSYLLQKGKILFEVTPLSIAELLPALEWLGKLPSTPVRISKLHRCEALPANFQGVPFETYIMVDNLYQGYLQTHQDTLLDELAGILYGKALKLQPFERINVFFWVASLKEYLAKKYPDFYQPMSAGADGNLLCSSTPKVEEAMNAQIRALTKGDITKEAEILAMDTWRALTELNAQVKEYAELNAKINSKS